MTVQALLNRILPRLARTGKPSGMDFMQAVNVVAELIFKRLWKLDADLVRAKLELNFPAGGSQTLPANFRGFKADPYTVQSGQTRNLSLLSEEERTAFEAMAPGLPSRYEVMGGVLYLYPAAAADLSVRGLIYAAPDEITAMTANLPYLELSLVFQEATLRLLLSGGIELAGQEDFARFVAEQIDKALPGRNRRNRRAKAYHF